MLHVLVHGGVYHATTGNWKACLSFFLFEGNDRYNEQKKCKRDDNLSEKKNCYAFTFFHTYRGMYYYFNLTLKI